MIDNEATFKKFGYYADDLKPQSNKLVVAVCDSCGKVREVVKQGYRSLCKSCSQTGRVVSIKTKEKISERMKGINKGELNGNWQGGLSFGKYCIKFNESLKTQIREKYNNCDYISGLHKSICNANRNLDVHHIDYDKQQGCGKSFKLIPLSRKNHNYTNFNRSFWNQLFKYSLEIDKWYYEGDYK